MNLNGGIFQRTYYSKMIVFFLYNVSWYRFQLHWSLMWWLNDSHNGNKHVRNFSYHSLYNPCVSLLEILKTLESSGWNLTKPTFGTGNPVHFSPFLNCLINQWYIVSGYEKQSVCCIDFIVIWISLSCYGVIEKHPEDICVFACTIHLFSVDCCTGHELYE